MSRSEGHRKEIVDGRPLPTPVGSDARTMGDFSDCDGRHPDATGR